MRSNVNFLSAALGGLAVLWLAGAASADGRYHDRVYADSFGNLITSIRREDLPPGVEPAAFRIEAASRRIEGIANTYSDSPAGAIVAVFGSGGYLELAVVQGSAAAQLKIDIRNPVCVEWQPTEST